MQFNGIDEALIRNIERNTSRYVELFCTAVDKVMPASQISATESEDILDVLWMHKQQRQQQRDTTNATDTTNQVTNVDAFPQELRRR